MATKSRSASGSHPPPSPIGGGLQAAIDQVRGGGLVLLYDGDDREGEIDLVAPAGVATPQLVRRMRTDAGGMLCVTIPPSVHLAWGLPLAEDLLASAATQHPLLRNVIAGKPAYDARSAFSLFVNARTTFTGITDADRSTTIQALASLVEETLESPSPRMGERFAQTFRAPGHVALLNCAIGGLAARRGHTELTATLLELGGLPGCGMICEMLGDDGAALDKAAGFKYAARHGLPFLEGAEVLSAWQNTSRKPEHPLTAPPRFG